MLIHSDELFFECFIFGSQTVFKIIGESESDLQVAVHFLADNSIQRVAGGMAVVGVGFQSGAVLQKIFESSAVDERAIEISIGIFILEIVKAQSEHEIRSESSLVFQIQITLEIGVY